MLLSPCFLQVKLSEVQNGASELTMLMLMLYFLAHVPFL